MLLKRITTVCAIVAALTITARLGVAQQVGHKGHDHAAGGHEGHDHAGHEHGSHSHGGETLAFFLPEWKSMHFDDAQQAAQHAAAVEKLGGEVKQDRHEGHSDVTYRVAKWREMKVKDHEMAQQWSKWLTNAGFDVSHSHVDPAYTKGPEVIEFRMLNWKRIHGNGSASEQQFVSALKKVGVEVRVDEHDGHTDIAYRAPTWRDVHAGDHSAADQLMGWLKQSGFDVHHED